MESGKLLVPLATLVSTHFPTKTLGGYGDGGLITVQDRRFLIMLSLRTHGSSIKYHHDYVGYNSRLDTLQAAILNVKLSLIDEGIAKRGACKSIPKSFRRY